MGMYKGKSIRNGGTDMDQIQNEIYSELRKTKQELIEKLEG